MKAKASRFFPFFPSLLFRSKGELCSAIGVKSFASSVCVRVFAGSHSQDGSSGWKKKKGSITVAYPYPDLSLPWWRTPRPIPPFTLGESSKDHGKFHFSLINGQKKYIANCVFFFLSRCHRYPGNFLRIRVSILLSFFKIHWIPHWWKGFDENPKNVPVSSVSKASLLSFFFLWSNVGWKFLSDTFIPRIAGIEFISNGVYTAGKNRLLWIFCSNSNIESFKRGRFHRFLSPIWYFRILHVIFDIAAAILGRTF